MAKVVYEFTEDDYTKEYIERSKKYLFNTNKEHRVYVGKLAEELQLCLPVIYQMFFPKQTYVFDRFILNKENKQYIQNRLSKIPAQTYNIKLHNQGSECDINKHNLTYAAYNHIKDTWNIFLSKEYKNKIIEINEKIKDMYHKNITSMESRSNLALFKGMRLEFEGIFKSYKVYKDKETNQRGIFVVLEELTCPITKQNYANHIHVAFKDLDSAKRIIKLEEDTILRFTGVVVVYDYVKIGIRDALYVSHKC